MIFSGIGNDGYLADIQGIYSNLVNLPGWAGISTDFIYENLTRTEILDSITALSSSLSQDDTLIWYYSGHGGYTGDEFPGDESAQESFFK